MYSERISLIRTRSGRNCCRELWSGSGVFVREKRREVKRLAAAEADGEAEEEAAAEVKKQARILQLAVMFGIWYLLNIYFNIYNKQVLCFCRFGFLKLQI